MEEMQRGGSLRDSPLPEDPACFPLALKGTYPTVLNPIVFVVPGSPPSNLSRLAPKAPDPAAPALEKPLLLQLVPEFQVGSISLASVPTAHAWHMSGLEGCQGYGRRNSLSPQASNIKWTPLLRPLWFLLLHCLRPLLLHRLPSSPLSRSLLPSPQQPLCFPPSSPWSQSLLKGPVVPISGVTAPLGVLAAPAMSVVAPGPALFPVTVAPEARALPTPRPRFHPHPGPGFAHTSGAARAAPIGSSLGSQHTTIRGSRSDGPESNPGG